MSMSLPSPRSDPEVMRSGPLTERGAQQAKPGIVVWAVAAILLAMHLAIGLGTLRFTAFPTGFDELQHLSVILAQREAPTIFPDHQSYRVISEDDFSQWTEKQNYLNHPSLYYLALAPFAGGDESIVPRLRAVNLFLSIAALVIAMAAGMRLFRTDAQRIVFLLLAWAFPKGPTIGGMINNDNLASLAGAIVVMGMAGGAPGAWLVAGGLALAGWTKLTALISLGLAVAAWRLILVWSDGLRLVTFDHALLGVGALAGACPYLVNYARTGQLLYVSHDQWWIPGSPGIMEFGAYFFDFGARLAAKWPAIEGSLPFALPLLILVAILTLGTALSGRSQPIALAFLAALAGTFALHVAFGWQAYIEVGDLSVAQTRYYNAIWPGLAAALTIAASRLDERRLPFASFAVVALCLAPTVAGLLVLSAAQ
jgi:hypothetical protein